ncbi:hypothetical protein [Chitinophaga sp. Cy-1792]|uniref:hypothetical protein n=1 Tax=Chitinophaga sp. Cy-1792 TaxID=2608339 RepID=UPI00141EF147|nr:hypothetical protein [Chitinophaga sp. Cy-1792]NIG54643.1 hypothetical protein [Chitinophaga sp. Cy-1792]
MLTNSTSEPIVRTMDDGNVASIVNYNVPEPTTYFGNKYFELNLKDKMQNDERFKGKDWREIFTDFTQLPFKGKSEAVALLSQMNFDDLVGDVTQILNYGYNHSSKPIIPSSGSISNSKTRARATVALDPRMLPSYSINERRYLISKLIYLPTNFEGLIKIRNNAGNELSPGFSNKTEFSKVLSNQIVNRLIDFKNGFILKQYERLFSIDNFSHIAQRILEGNFLCLYQKFAGHFDYKFIPIPEEITPKIAIVEKYKLSNFLGNYGAGRTIKTFTLLPGEKTKITVKTYKKTEIDSKQSSSILDSFSSESANDFENTLNNERSDKHAHQDKLDWHVNLNEDLDFGFSDTKLDAGLSGESSNQRENMTKQVSNSVTKHSEKASSKRDVNIDTSYENKTETGEETSIEREIENINVSRTLNFVFRQMNQEFLTLFHLIDAKISYSSGLPGGYEEIAISSLGTPENIGEFLKSKLTNSSFARDILSAIVNHLCFVSDYNGNFQSFLTRVTKTIDNPVIPSDKLKLDYIGADKKLFISPDEIDLNNPPPNVYVSPDKKLVKVVTGIIVSAQTTVMRTEGIMVEALLGQGDALDTYSHGLQDEKVREKKLNNDKIELANNLISNNETDKGKLFEQVYPCCPDLVCGCNNSKTETK